MLYGVYSISPMMSLSGCRICPFHTADLGSVQEQPWAQLHCVHLEPGRCVMNLDVLIYPLVNIQKTMKKNHHFEGVNQPFLWSFSRANCYFTRGHVGHIYIYIFIINYNKDIDVSWIYCRHPLDYFG